jgi:hypothetical protein
MAPHAQGPMVQRLAAAYGNRFVGRVVPALQDPAPLPASADNLRRFREGMPRLVALAGLAAPAVDVADLAAPNEWLRDVVETLRLVEPIADPSNLLFESLLGSEHDAEYADAQNRIRPQLTATLARVVPIALATGTRLRDLAVEGVNASTVVDAARAADPALPPLAQVTAWREGASALRALAAEVDRGGSGLAAAAHACEEAALALLQARSVVEARETWRSADTREAALGDVPKHAGTQRTRDEVDDIFADSGFNSQQSLREDGTMDDWCGMFAAANMFRAAALDKDMRLAFAHTDNVHDFFNYDQQPTNRKRTPVSIWAEDRWWNLREYHQERGFPRTWVQGAAVDGADIRPGDIVLIRHQGSKPADGIANHIVMVESYDPATQRLVTIEGNVHEGIRADASGEAERTATGELASTTRRRDSSVVHVRDLSDTATTTPGAGPGGVYQERGRRTVFGIGRPSIIDFEDHDYGLIDVPAEYTALSPAEIRARKQGKKHLQPPSTMQAPATGPYHTRTGGP